MASVWLQGVVLGVAVAASPGPIGLTAIREGLERGAGPAWRVGLGAATGDLVHVILVYLGLSPLLLRVEWLAPLLAAAGALILGRMAFGALRAALRPAGEGAAAAPLRTPYLTGLAITMVNPMAIASWISLGGGFVSTHLGPGAGWFALAALASIAAGAALYFTALAGFLGLARGWVARGPLVRAANGVSGLLLAYFAASLALRAAQSLLHG